MAEQDIVERLRNGKPEVYAAIQELRKWADWYVSCACGNVPDEAAAAYLLIEEFNRIDAALTEERSVYIMAHGIFQTEALRSKNEIDKLTTEIASLRQQLAEARETARREALEEAAKLIEANSFHKTTDGYVLEPRMQGDRYGLAYATAIRALPHPDREGERECQ